MKNKKLVLILLAFVLLLGISYFGYKYLLANYKETPTPPKDKISLNDKTSPENEDKNLAPDFTVYDEAGNKVKLSDYKGTPVVLNFWASWCPPCKYEMPFFEEAYKKYNDNGVAILMINMTDGQRETKDIALNYMKENNFEMKTFLDSDLDASNAYQIMAIPRTLFIDKDGYIVLDHQGLFENSEDLIKNIEELIK